MEVEDLRYSIIAGALLFAACAPVARITPEPEESRLVGADDAMCPAHSHATLESAFAPEQPDYEPVVSTCISRSTPGWVDVHGILAATSAVDVHVVASIADSAAGGWAALGPELQAPLGWALGTPVGGSVYAPAGNHVVSIRVSTGAPSASVVVLSGTWIEAEARQ